MGIFAQKYYFSWVRSFWRRSRFSKVAISFEHSVTGHKNTSPHTIILSSNSQLCLSSRPDELSSQQGPIINVPGVIIFQVKKLDSGELNSFEFSEYSVRSKHQNLRVIVKYRPPYSDDHKVLTTTMQRNFLTCWNVLDLCSM